MKKFHCVMWYWLSDIVREDASKLEPEPLSQTF